MPLTLAQIAEKVDGELSGPPESVIHGAAPFEQAGPEDITFAEGRKFLKGLADTGAGAVLVPKDCPDSKIALVRVDHPKVAFAKVLDVLYPNPVPPPDIHPTAQLGDDVTRGEDVFIGPMVAVGNRVSLGDRVQLHPGAVIGAGVHIGNETIIGPNVSILERCRVGNRVFVQAGTVIGSDGFGFAHDGQIYHKIRHLGIVQIDDDVEIGAGNTIDRATFGKTWIQKGVKTDNLVHIAHNCTIGENSIIVAGAMMGGSVTVGSHVIIAGQAAIAQHLSIGDNAIVGPRAGIAKSVPAGEVHSGNPQVPHRVWLKNQRLIPRLPEIKKQIADMERRLKHLENKTNGDNHDD